MSEQIQIQHRHHKRVDAAPIIDAPAGGPDDQTLELLLGSEDMVEKISRALVADSVQAVC
jgi:hypothetical protein